MSPANVYRFFSSKQAMNDAVADRLFAEVIALATEASVTPRTPAERLRATLAAIEKRHADRFLNEKHLHELMVISAREDWLVSRSFTERIESIVADIVSEGIARHQFQGGDSIIIGRCLLVTTAAFCDPRLVATTGGFHRPNLEQISQLEPFVETALLTARAISSMPPESRFPPGRHRLCDSHFPQMLVEKKWPGSV